MSQKKFSTAVLVLSVTCAFLFGIISGYVLTNMMLFMRFSNFPESSVVSRDAYEDNRDVRRDIVFFSPGNDELWDENYKQISAGNGELIGKVFIDDKPATDLELSLIVASGRKTQKTKVDLEGNYKISLPRGKYFFNGILIYNKSQEINDKFLINKISKNEGFSIHIENANNSSIQDEYLKLEKELGPEEAAKEMLKNFAASTPFKDKFPFKIGGKPYNFPDIHYRKPISVLSPANHSKSSIRNLRFIWEPVDEASYYKAIIIKIEMEGTTTSYHNMLALSNIETNNISYSDLLEKFIKERDKDSCDNFETLQKNKSYGFRVFAYNAKDQIITASSNSQTDSHVFSLESKN